MHSLSASPARFGACMHFAQIRLARCLPGGECEEELVLLRCKHAWLASVDFPCARVLAERDRRLLVFPQCSQHTPPWTVRQVLAGEKRRQRHRTDDGEVQQAEDWWIGRVAGE